jgi:hypothetical protein
MRTVEQQYARELSRMQRGDRLLARAIARFRCLMQQKANGESVLRVRPVPGWQNHKLALEKRVVISR